MSLAVTAMAKINHDDPWAKAPYIIPVVGGPADGSLIVRPKGGRLVFGGLGPIGRELYVYTVRQYRRSDGAIVEVFAYGDEPVDPQFVKEHGLTAVQ